MKKTYSPVFLSIEHFDRADVLTASTPTVFNDEQYFNGGSDFFA